MSPSVDFDSGPAKKIDSRTLGKSLNYLAKISEINEFVYYYDQPKFIMGTCSGDTAGWLTLK